MRTDKTIAHIYFPYGCQAPAKICRIEYYEDKPIFYSLGNFWFDEYNVDTMLVNIRISGNDDGDKIDVSVVPAVQDGTLQGCVTRICTQEEDKSRIFSLLNKVSINANVADDGTVTQVK